ncbi:MAG TPA: hypothetical protein VN782_13960 [Usitatibacter sp.]|nr:hypothetical protein [Usitatibacter sp.]
MSEPNDRLERAYRSLAREEPPAALDARVLAAAHRAVARPSAARRWGVPVSLAALLVLAVGVTLEMQHEQPGIETSAPSERPSAPAEAAPAPPAQPMTQPAPQAQSMAKPAPQAQPIAKPGAQARSSPARPLEAKRASPAIREEGRGKEALQAEAPAANEAPAVRELPRPFAAETAPAQPQENTTHTDRLQPAPAPAAPPPSASASTLAVPRAEQRLAAPTANVAKRSAAAGASADSSAVPMDPAVELERIAKLRAAGRDAEADRALEEFRKRYPGYRIDDAMWQRVKPR